MNTPGETAHTTGMILASHRPAVAGRGGPDTWWLPPAGRYTVGAGTPEAGLKGSLAAYRPAVG
jgi:hypothetical protein